MSVIKRKWPLAALCSALSLSLLLVGCGDSSSSNSSSNSYSGPTETLKANIRYTTGGVPHITAANLKDAGFASGYVQAKANACIIADQILRTEGERSKYYGPGESINPPLSSFFAGKNVVSDFSIKALDFMGKAKAAWPNLTTDTKDLLRGFASGYNYYLKKTDNLSNVSGRYARCAGKPWVKNITPQEVFAYYSLVAQYASGLQFATGATFFASPGSKQAALPHPVRQTALNIPTAAKNLQLASLQRPVDFTHLDMGSNGWGISGAMTKNGKGALLANPHFPYTGARRLFQMQINVPSKGYNVNGAALLGVVIPLIGFNDHVAWTHTVSTGHHFTIYSLNLKAGDPMTYMKGGTEHKISKKNIQISVASNAGPVKMEKTFYYSEYGPMLNMNLVSSSFPEWGHPFAVPPGYPTGPNVAFSYKDANVATANQMMDQWLQMGEAQNLAEFQDAYKQDASGACSSVLWVNTMYADDQGNAFYIDGTAVPKLSATAIATYKAQAVGNPYVGGLAQKGITLLDGSKPLNDWDTSECPSGLSGYADMPKLASDATVKYVQNSNDSYWATNTNNLMTNPSPLYGPTNQPLSPRTRMGLKALNNPADAGLSDVKPAGADGKFTGKEVIDNLYANRAYYAEEFLPELLNRCTAIGTTNVSGRSVEKGCAALSAWNGSVKGAVFNTDSVGAAVFRVFIGQYAKVMGGHYSTAFDSTDPANTPSGVDTTDKGTATDPMLVALAKGLNQLDAAGITDYQTPLGDLQFVQQSSSVPPGATSTPVGAPIPWGGNQNMEGGFNIVAPVNSQVADDTRFPRVAPAKSDILDDTGLLSKQTTGDGPGWYIARGTSWHFGLEFTAGGPKAWGLVSYSQSADSGSPHFSDQDTRFSAKDYRELLYTDAQINADSDLKTLNLTATVPAN